MEAAKKQNVSNLRRKWNKFWTYISKPQNAILLVLGIILTVTTIYPMVTILNDTVQIHPGSIDAPDPNASGAKALEKEAEKEAAHFTLLGNEMTTYNWVNLFTGTEITRINRKRVEMAVAATYLIPALKNSVLISIFACFGAILYGGIFAYLVTRTNLRFKKYLSAIFIFPYIMPQWTLAVMWENLFDSAAITGGSDGLFASLFGINMPQWWCEGLFPVSLVLSIHYAPFAYILIGGIFRNMDANLEEAATILNTPRYKTFARVTLPLVKPAILSTILLVFSSAMGSYPIPHYLGLDTLSTRYVQMNADRAGQASILAVIMMLFGILIMIVNQKTTSGRKNYTTVTGKSGQSSLVNLRLARTPISILFILLTLFMGIFPIILFAVETFLPNPGDYSFLKNLHCGNLLCPCSRYHWYADRLLRQQKPEEQVGSICQQHRIPAISDAVAGRRRCLLYPVSQHSQFVQLFPAADPCRYGEIHSVCKQKFTELDDAAVRGN